MVEGQAEYYTAHPDNPDVYREVSEGYNRLALIRADDDAPIDSLIVTSGDLDACAREVVDVLVGGDADEVRARSRDER